MIRITWAALAIGVLSLAACQQEPSNVADNAAQPERSTPAADVSARSVTSPQAASSPSPSPGDMAGENDGSPDITPAVLTPEAARGEKGARANLLAWARGIELREFDQAWDLMGDAAQAQISKAQFNALFHPLREIAVTLPGGRIEGAAGSSYYTVPATVTGARADGSKAVLRGEVVLCRVNDIDGATAEQLNWHIEQVNLKPA